MNGLFFRLDDFFFNSINSLLNRLWSILFNGLMYGSFFSVSNDISRSLSLVGVFIFVSCLWKYLVGNTGPLIVSESESVSYNLLFALKGGVFKPLRMAFSSDGLCGKIFPHVLHDVCPVV